MIPQIIKAIPQIGFHLRNLFVKSAKTKRIDMT